VVEGVHIQGRILYLTEDASVLSAQLDGVLLSFSVERELINSISTDEITPGWVCYYYDETLARYCLVGLRGGHIKKDAIRNGGFGVIVSGASKGCGSSRETAPYSELKSGVQLVIAKSFEKIYQQNAQNIGLLTSTNFALIPRIERGEVISHSEFTAELDPISRSIVECGGLFAYNRARLSGAVSEPKLASLARPMTLCEKVLSRHAMVSAKQGLVGVDAVCPGDAFFARTDVRFSHEYVTPMAESLFTSAFGKDACVREPASVFAFRDHLTFLDLVMPKAHKEMGLQRQAASLAIAQEAFTTRQHIKLFGEVYRDGKSAGSEAICHNKVLEEIALPGQLVIGTDSHTCMAGALGCFAFGVGSTDMANAWYTNDVRVTVPETVQFVLRGSLAKDVCAKDVMLHLLRMPFFKSGEGIGKVLEFSGPAIAAMSLDERATLTNMAVEAGSFTGIIEADEVVVDYLVSQRGLDAASVRALIVRADPGAHYRHVFELDLAQVVPMVALPGDPRNGVAITALKAEAKAANGGLRIDIAYGGSCTSPSTGARPGPPRAFKGTAVHSVRLARHSSLCRETRLHSTFRKHRCGAGRAFVRRLH
jgi:3-isopropylmalate/(R)-2-methylmalate dehydratase large subunit